MRKPALEKPSAYSPFWQSPGGAVKLWQGHVLDVLRALPARSVQCVATSPPYWGLRDYGTGGAQLGLEPTPQEYVDKMVEVFREVRRVLRDDGTLWLNLGDSYAGAMPGRNDVDRKYGPGSQGRGLEARRGLEAGNLVGIPWRVALALQADGWVLRQDIIWSKPSPMPESVRNRCTKAHEYVFLLTKGMGYFYDAEAIKENGVSGEWNSRRSLGTPRNKTPSDPVLKDMQRTQYADNTYHPPEDQTGANKRSVWTVAAQGYPGAHFAVWPPKLVALMIRAGTSAKGACALCGAPWERIVARVVSDARVSGGGNCIGKQGHSAGGTGAQQESNYKQVMAARTVGWRPSCACGAGIVPCVVLDPFCGSGTTAAEAARLGRAGWGIDLSEKYLRENAVPRVKEALAGDKEIEACGAAEDKPLEVGGVEL